MPERPPLPESVSGCILEATLREGPGEVVVRSKDSLGLPLDLHLFPGDAVAPRLPKGIFFDQVRATAALHHERLSSVVNAGEKGPWWFVACKGTEGATLANLFSRGHMDEERALAIFAGVSEGLAVLEAAGLHHGALDPLAIGLPGAGQVRLALRRLVPPDLAARDPRYTSPEEARGEEGNVRSDLYVLGLLLAEALYGKPLLSGTAEEIRLRVSRGEVPAVSVMLRGVLPQTVDLVRSLLSTDPRGRPASATDTARILRSLQAAFTATESLEGSALQPMAALPIAPEPPVATAAPAADSAFVAPAAALAAAAAVAPAPRTRRAHARLIVPFRGVEQIHELVDPVTWIGPAEEGRIVARPAEFPGALARLEVGAQADTLVAVGAGPKPVLRGQEVARADLQFGDSFRIGSEEVTFEKAGRLLPEGAEGAEEGRTRRIRERPSRLPLVGGFALCAAALAWGVLRYVGASGARAGEIEKSRTSLAASNRSLEALPVPAATGAAAAADQEMRALALLEAAREERTAGRATAAREKLEALLRLHPASGAALLAAEELRELRASLRDPGLEELRGVQAKAEGLASEGKFGEAFELLHAFSDAHGGSLAGDRASLAAESIARIAADRVEDLLRDARAAADRKDWQGALNALSRAEGFAAGESRQKVDLERQKILKAIPRGVPGGSARPPAEDAKEDRPNPKDPARPPEKPPATKPAPNAREDEATNLFRACREALEANRPGEAERGFYRLLTAYADAKFVRDYGQEIRQRYEDAVRKGHGVAGLFHGTVTFKGNRLSVSYEFEDPAEAADWETVHCFATANKGTFETSRGQVAGRGAAAYMMRACFRPDLVHLSFKVHPENPAQDMGAMMAEPKDLSNFLMFTVANDFFKLGKGDKAYAIPGNVIFVFGKGMWKSTDPGMVGFVKTAASEDPRVEPGKWTEMEIAKEKDAARWKFLGKTLSGKAIGDNKYELTGIRPALFVLLSEARFDEVTVEGEPDPEWVRAERERVFPGTR